MEDKQMIMVSADDLINIINYCHQMENEINVLNNEIEWITKEVLSSFAGLICTPEEGYLKAGLNWMIHDIKEVVKIAESRRSNIFLCQK